MQENKLKFQEGSTTRVEKQSELGLQDQDPEMHQVSN